MGVEENKALFRRFWEMDDFKGIPPSDYKPTMDRIWAEIFAPNFVLHAGTADMPLEGLLQYWTSRLSAFPDQECTVEDIIGEGEKVVIRLTIRGTHQGDFLGIAATGKTIVEKLVAIGGFTNGRMTEGWSYYGVGGSIMQLLGVTPPNQ